MQDLVEVTGFVLKSAPVLEADRRVTILTRERGKITAFARGARKPTSKFVASCDSFTFGNFKLFEGREAYNLQDADIKNYFEEIRTDFDKSLFASFFSEVADYYTRENNDESEMLKLLYKSFQALVSDSYDNRLVKAIFEIKALAINGEMPSVANNENLSDATKYTIDFIINTNVEKLFVFKLKDEVLEEFCNFAEKVFLRITGQKFKSLEILKTL